MPCIFITHPEVVIDPTIAVEEWQLSEVGRRRAALLPSLMGDEITTIVSSAERKAVETAAILAEALHLEPVADVALGEMNRSATGYLPPVEFEPTVDAFFLQPAVSIKGWERAVDAQRRIERAVRHHIVSSGGEGVAFVSHGGVGGLLLASLTRSPISRALDQPGLGSYFTFDPHRWAVTSQWRPIS